MKKFHNWIDANVNSKDFAGLRAEHSTPFKAEIWLFIILRGELANFLNTFSRVRNRRKAGNKRRAFNRAVGPEKKSKLINVGPTFIPDYNRVGNNAGVLCIFIAVHVKSVITIVGFKAKQSKMNCSSYMLSRARTSYRYGLDTPHWSLKIWKSENLKLVKISKKDVISFNHFQKLCLSLEFWWCGSKLRLPHPF